MFGGERTGLQLVNTHVLYLAGDESYKGEKTGRCDSKGGVGGGVSQDDGMSNSISSGPGG